MPPNILKLLGQIQKDDDMAMVIRHAERFEINSPEEYWTCGLTDAGIQQARDLGQEIAGHFDSYRLFFSPVRRCRETAENIMASLESSHAEIISIGPEEVLGLSYILVDIVDGFHEADKFGDGFIRAWFDGDVDQDIFMPLHHAKNKHLDYLQDKFSTANGGRNLDIHVTHDWNINVLREGIFGLKHEDMGWPGYLSGLGFSGNPFTAFLNHEMNILEKTLSTQQD